MANFVGLSQFGVSRGGLGVSE